MKNKLWGGRFSKNTNPMVEDFTRSIQFDKKLAKYDCLGSIAHARMLGKCNIIPKKDAAKIISGLNSILNRIKKDSFKIDDSQEDIHTVIQNALYKKIGKSAGMLHTARSRNDQVSLDTRMYCKKEIDSILALIAGLKASIKQFSKKNMDVVIPGFTHLQNAQPVLLSHQMLAYCQMLERDIARLIDCKKRVDVLPLGSCAISGTSLPIDRNVVANELGFSKVSSNSMDAVSDRDFIIETLSTLAITGMHLSRLAEDLILWSTKEFDFIDIDEAFCTGSSLMPHKKNPDVLELIRGNTGKLYGNLMSVLVMMKGLPLAYNRDMQLDKEPLFNSFEIIQDELKILAELLPNIKFKKDNITKQLEDECLYATDMADYLVKNKVAFKDAHTIIGKLISHKLKSKKDIKDMTDDELKKFHPLLSHKVMKKIIDPEISVKSKRSIKRI